MDGGQSGTYTPGRAGSPRLTAEEKQQLDDTFGAFGRNHYTATNFLDPSSRYDDLPNGQPSGSRGGAGGGGRGYGRGCVPTNPIKRRGLFFGVPIALLVIAAIAVGVTVGVSKHNDNANHANNGNGTANSGQDGNNGGNGGGNVTQLGTAGNGGNGSMATTDLGVEYTYTNPFGGTWAQDPKTPYMVGWVCPCHDQDHDHDAVLCCHGVRRSDEFCVGLG